MTQPVPEIPTNVQSTNPYVGLDRGLFLYRAPGLAQYARIHAARWVCNGPRASVGVLEYQVMTYSSKPETAAQYAAGTLLDAPNGTKWFDTFTRGLVATPIMAEYWAVNSYYTHYAEAGAEMLGDLEKANILAQSKVFVETMAKWAGLDAVEITMTFNAVAGQPLSLTSQNLGIDYTRDTVSHHVDLVTLPTGEFDAVQVALSHLKTI